MQSQAVLLMVGMIVGAGIFAVPYVFSLSGIGFGTVVLLIVLAIVALTHRMYTDIVIATQGKHRLVGNVEAVLGSKARTVASTIIIFGNLASLLVYMVLGGTFLHALFGNILQIPVMAYQVAFLVCGTLSLGYGPSMVTRLNSAFTVAMLVLLVALAGWSAWYAYIPNIVFADTTKAMLPYGVVLFSLNGVNAIPEIYALLKGKRAETKRAVTVGSLIAAGITLAFGVAVAAFTGPFTTPDAITGLARSLGNWVLVVGACTGLLAVFTSFIILALNVDETFRLDFQLSKRQAWLAATIPVLVAFLLGARNLVSIISFTGTMLSGATVILIALVYRKMLQSKSSAPFMEYGAWAPVAVIGTAILGMVLQVQ